MVGQGVFPHKINRTFIMEQHRSQQLHYIRSDLAVAKDTIQVPRNGYVIIRTRLDNPGHWLVHCHIEVHFKQGMSLVIKIGSEGDWNTGPESLDVECSEQKPRSLEGAVTVLSILKRL